MRCTKISTLDFTTLHLEWRVANAESIANKSALGRFDVWHHLFIVALPLPIIAGRELSNFALT
jgi:hypothetical protein